MINRAEPIFSLFGQVDFFKLVFSFFLFFHSRQHGIDKVKVLKKFKCSFSFNGFLKLKKCNNENLAEEN